MNSASRFSSEKSEELPNDILQLERMIAALPREYGAEIEPVFTRVLESTKRRRRILMLVQEALSQLRLDMKYLVFDLEATRRERDALRQEGENRDSNRDDCSE
jgi:hypothetical protein